MPPAPHAVDLEGFAESCATAVLDRLQVANSVYISTDGGSKDYVGACAVVVHCALNVFSAGDGHEDRAFKQEPSAVHYAAQGLVIAGSRGAAGHAFLVSDCQAAISAIVGTSTPSANPSLIHATRLLLARARSYGITHSWIWVPSHGKQPKWKPPPEHCAWKICSLNDAADEEAPASLHTRLQGSLRQRWHAHDSGP